MNDHDTLTTGALLLGGGALGYAAGRWLLAPGASAATPTRAAITTVPTAAAPMTPTAAPAVVLLKD